MILLGGPLLQPLVTHSVQDEPRRIGHDDDASRLLGHLPELLREDVGERPKRMLEPAPEHLQLVGLDRGQRVGRIEACGQRAPPRLDDRRSQSRRGSGWGAQARVRRRRADAPNSSAAAERASAGPSPLRQPPTATSWLCEHIPLDPLDPAELSGERAPSSSERSTTAADPLHEAVHGRHDRASVISGTGWRCPAAQTETGSNTILDPLCTHRRLIHGLPHQDPWTPL
jgi:hypothetical protein